MSTTNTIVLRPRFKKELSIRSETVLKTFENSKVTQQDFIITRIDDHVFIKYPKAKQHFWSPQLHLEINAIDENSSLLYGLFGPNPTVWSLFMFFHFMVAALFIGIAVWAYTNWSLDKTYSMQLSIMMLLVLIWIALYFIGSVGKNSSKKEMHELYAFMNVIIQKERKE
ncbi:GTP-binding protein [Joostella atrarenae]|uniref:GTP-binding protein n=1 Tax=Joostella atrarenae TaxID=679257 RepID=A0ABS9J2B7_9FLAO|nr:GTP-binding protein [Joostella atrarenae]MCF8714559.1 GTP-binding protein [Joostella atrarenae]